jgi:hypothetical protein
LPGITISSKVTPPTPNRNGSKKRTSVHVRFSEDFTVSYKNNVAPGTATLTISGIGKYTGEIITTFKIAARV